MIDAIQNMIDDIVEVERTTDDIILDLVKTKEDKVIRMNIDDQLYQGFDSNGQSIKPPYRPKTVRKKKRKGDPYDRVTLRDEGDFHASFFVIYGGDEFELSAKDAKKVWLERRYGSAIYGLTDDNVERLRNLIREPLIDELKKRILK